MLPRAKRALAGTYFAEQVATASYDLVRISHAENNARPGTQQSSSGTSGASRPTTTGAPRRRNVVGDKVQCTELPSLNNLELLLQSESNLSGDKDQNAHGDDFEDWLYTRDPRFSKQGFHERRAHRIHKMCSRLCRGEQSTPRKVQQSTPRKVPSKRTEACATPSDMEVVASLTQPLSHFTRTHGSRMASTRLRGKLHNSYQEAVSAGLAGTEFDGRPRRMPLLEPIHLCIHQKKTKKNHVASSSTIRTMQSVPSSKSLVILDVPVLPEDAAQAYLQKENFASQDQKQCSDVSDELIRELENAGTTEKHRRGSDQLVSNLAAETDALLGCSQGGVATQKLMLPSIEGSSPSVSPAPAVSEPPQHPLLEAETPHQMSDASPPCAAQEMDVDPHDRILDAVPHNAKMSSVRREAAQALRIFLFGAISETKKALAPKDVEKVLRERTGSHSQVNQLYAFWCKLDHDRSGAVDMKEFRSFVELAMKDLVDGTNRLRGVFSAQAFKEASPQENAVFAQKMCDRVQSAILGKKGTFVIEDVMRVLWPCSRNSDLKSMKGWCNELELTTWRTATPKQLAREDFDALAAVFRFFDNDGSGSVTVDELIHSGLMDKEQAMHLVQEADGTDGDGMLSMVEFCELFCPTGYRAHSQARVGTDDTGRRLVYDERMHGWRLEEMDPGKAGLFS